MQIVGTAGHVDHGKSSLVLALTGTNPDRWVEERERGMTLDLGFARLRYDGVDAGVVDVPGHERFVHNMLAGAPGMDVLMLVVALTEGVREQTREHMEILRLLGIGSVVVAATKADLVDDVDVAVGALREQLRETFADGAPIVPVSSITGLGLDELRAQLALALSRASRRAVDAPVFLPIDRVFTLAGRGTIVTGTLMQGEMRVGESLVIPPQGREVRVRSLQVFGESRDVVTAGARVAANLASIERAEIERGDALCGHEYGAQRSLRVRFSPLAEATPLLRRRTPVRVHIGSAEVLGTLVFAAVPSDGAEVRAELHLREAVAAFPGLRYVVRRPSPKTLLGGGTIESIDAPSETRDAPSGVDGVVLALLRERALAPTEPAQAAFLTNLRENVAIEALDRLVESGDALRLARPAAYLDAVAARELFLRVRNELEARETREPWAMGTTTLALSRALQLPEAFLQRAIAAFAENGELRLSGGFVSTPSYVPHLTSDQQRFFDAVFPIDRDAPNRPVPFADIAEKMRHSNVAGISRAFDTLIARGALVRVGDEIYRGAQIAAMHRAIEAFVKTARRFTVSDFRDVTGTSRKYAVPLLEWFDARGITIRDGDYRTVRASARK